MRCTSLSWRTLVPLAMAWAGAAQAQAVVYTDRTAFEAAAAAAGLALRAEAFEAAAPGPLAPGAAVGGLRIGFDAALTQPAVVADGNGGQALGGSPFDAFVGGDRFSFTAGAGHVLRAFGADVVFAPSGGDLPGGVYALAGGGATAFSAALLAAGGGSLFLGLITDTGSDLGSAGLSALDGSAQGFLTPAWQVDNLLYAAPVPEPPSPWLLAAGLAAVALRRQRRSTDSQPEEKHR